MTQTMRRTRTVRYAWVLVAWTLLIWGSRVRNIFADDDLMGFDRVLSLGVALTLVGAAVSVAIALRRTSSWMPIALGVLVVVGIARWTIRGPIILASDEWEVGFKVVHTVLWLVTVALSLLAWSEHRSAEAQ